MVEMGADFCESVAAILTTVMAGVAQDIELDVKELFELEAELGLLELGGAAGVMDLMTGVVAGDEMERGGVGGDFW